MTTRGIKPSEAPKWVEKSADKAKKRLIRAIEVAARRMVVHLQTEIIPQTQPHAPVDRGLFRAGWRVHPHARGVTVFNTTPGNYGPHIEYGVRAANVKIGRRMIDALAAWAKRKGLQPRPIKARARLVDGKHTFGPAPSGRDSYRGIAFAIARGMKKRGIFNRGKGLRVLERAFKAYPRFLHAEIAAMKRAGGG